MDRARNNRMLDSTQNHDLGLSQFGKPPSHSKPNGMASTGSPMHGSHEANVLHHKRPARFAQTAQLSKDVSIVPGLVFHSNAIPGPSHGHGFDNSSIFVNGPDGRSLQAAPTPDFTAPLDARPATTSIPGQRSDPEYCDSCTESAPDNTRVRPPPPPPPSQPPQDKAHVSKPPIIYDPATETRIQVFNKDTQKFVKTYGGYPLENQIKVLERLEAWIRENNGDIITVTRKNGMKGGVENVTCNVCVKSAHPDPDYVSIQKAAEHILSFHWELSTWACVDESCDKDFRRKQECDRHEETTHGIVPRKKATRLAKEKSVTDVAPKKSVIAGNLSAMARDPNPTTGRSRVKRHEQTLAVPGGPTRNRSSSQQPPANRGAPYPSQEETRDLRHTASAPSLRSGSDMPPPPRMQPPTMTSRSGASYGPAPISLQPTASYQSLPQVTVDDYSTGYQTPDIQFIRSPRQEQFMPTESRPRMGPYHVQYGTYPQAHQPHQRPSHTRSYSMYPTSNLGTMGRGPNPPTMYGGPIFTNGPIQAHPPFNQPSQFASLDATQSPQEPIGPTVTADLGFSDLWSQIGYAE